MKTPYGMTVHDLTIHLSKYADDAPVMIQIQGEAFDITSVDIDRVDGDADMAVLLGIE